MQNTDRNVGIVEALSEQIRDAINDLDGVSELESGDMVRASIWLHRADSPDIAWEQVIRVTITTDPVEG